MIRKADGHAHQEDRGRGDDEPDEPEVGGQEVDDRLAEQDDDEGEARASSSRTGTIVKTSLPASVSRRHDRAMTVMQRAPPPARASRAEGADEHVIESHSNVRERARGPGNARIGRPARASLVDAAHDRVEAKP